ncbi:DUF2252 domain-containing protein [Actinomadura gamaensis]|uniref:DUF2252 domain-containing protein n=1 Tax=Actinomadura gamaensis TaxID=1763541 RepID=A0ABV9U130_9ACTN
MAKARAAASERTRLSAGGGHPTPDERAELGRAARAAVPRSEHAVYEPDAKRPDPVDVLEAQSATRVPELVPIRYGRMLESPFRFYRGAAAIMAADLGTAPHTGIAAQLCGDAHLLNFRLLASPERHLIFDINDFDETLPGPWEWDVKRLATSLVIAGRANGFPRRTRRTIVRAAVAGYRERTHELAAMRTLDVWYAMDDAGRLDAIRSDRLGRAARRRASQAASQARRRTSMQAYRKLTVVDGGRRRIAPDPPLIVPIRDLLPGTAEAELEQSLRRLVDTYAESLTLDHRRLLRRFQIVDMARKVVGVGSVGTRCWIILLLGRDGDDPLLLQAKEAGESVLAPFTTAFAGAGREENGREENQGRRVVAGQRLMQAASDIFLGWERAEGFDGRRRDFYVRQLRDWKGIAQPESMSPALMTAFGRLCGASLARAHARSGDAIAVAAYLGRADVFDRACAEFAEAYADQNERDHRALRTAVLEGRVIAESA